MPKVVITYEYEPNLDHYPGGTETAADAMRYDVQQVQEGYVCWNEFLDPVITPATLTVDVVE